MYKFGKCRVKSMLPDFLTEQILMETNGWLDSV